MDRQKQDILHEWLLVRYRRGDPSAMDELIRVWEKPLFYYLRRLLDREEDVWDTLQDVWMKVMKSLPGLHDARALSPWLYKIARNTAVSQFRREKHYQSLDEPEDLEALPDPDTESLPAADALDVHRALERLSLPHREVLTLRFLEGFDVDEIAEITETPAGTVKSRLFYAKREMRALLEERKMKIVEGGSHV